MERLLISTCLLGLATRYDGRSKTVLSEADISKLSERYELVPVCPEIYGGLPTPRIPAEISFDRVLRRDGVDVTENYRRGAESTLAIARIVGAKAALLKERSPSCGKGKIYDGSFSSTLTDGDGVTVALLLGEGIKVYGESEIDKLLADFSLKTE